jgi:leader peptidase (prepilin peptidase)/N-methyltransferase
MGFGDVKLAPILGATLGWVAVSVAIVGLVLAFVLGAVVGVALMMGKRADRRTAIPFGPFLLAGALLGLVAGRALVTAYGELLTAS